MFDVLPENVLWLVLLNLDGETLARLEGVNRTAWKMIDTEALWLNAVRKRWHVHSVKNRHLQISGESNVWRNIYINWRSVRRMPTSPFSGQRFPLLARSGRIARKGCPSVVAWVSLRPAEDTFMNYGCVHLRVIVQNLGIAAIELQPERVEVKLRQDLDSEIYFPGEHVGTYRSDRYRHLVSGMPQARRHASAKAADSSLSLLQYDFVVLQVKVRLPLVNVIEPELLERLSELSLYVRGPNRKRVAVNAGAQSCLSTRGSDRVGTDGRSARGGGDGGDSTANSDDAADLSKVTCVFEEKRIWDYYERLPGGFWLFVDPH